MEDMGGCGQVRTCAAGFDGEAEEEWVLTIGRLKARPSGRAFVSGTCPRTIITQGRMPLQDVGGGFVNFGELGDDQILENMTPPERPGRPGGGEEQLMRIFFGILVVVSMPMLAGGEEWKLVWSDEFNKAGLPDAAKWDYETGLVRNHERQFYTRARRENARVENGMLIIEARKEKYRSPSTEPAARSEQEGREKLDHQGADYTSASLTTSGKAAWTYGRIEVRAKLPSGRGTWPAIWTLGTNIDKAGWPSCGEIDIMEFVGFEPGIIHANIHTRKYNHVMKPAKATRSRFPRLGVVSSLCRRVGFAEDRLLRRRTKVFYFPQ